MPASVTYRFFDLLSLRELDSLPLQGVNFGKQVNAPGQFAGQLPITDPRIQNLDWRTATTTGNRALIVDISGVPVWGGIVWTRNYQRSQGIVKIGANEFGSYIQHRLQAFDYSTTWASGADPMTVAHQVVVDALAKGTIMGGINVVLNPAGGEGGNQVQPSYPGTSLQTIESILSLLSQMGYSFGFDYSFDVSYLPGTRTPAVTCNIWFPRQGRTADQTQITLFGKDLLDYSYPEDSTAQATSISETGSGTGGVQPAVASVNLPGYPLLEMASPRTQVIDEGTLSNIALGDLGMHSYPVITPSVDMPLPMPNEPGFFDSGRLTLGDFSLGDDLVMRIDPVATSEPADPRFPSGMSFEYRITAWKATIADKGVSTLHLDFGVPPAQIIPPPFPPI